MKRIIAIAIGIIGLSACTPAQIDRYLPSQDTPAPVVVVVDTGVSPAAVVPCSPGTSECGPQQPLTPVPPVIDCAAVGLSPDSAAGTSNCVVDG